MRPSSIAIAVAALLVGTAFAQTEAPQAADEAHAATQNSAFQALDADHDGKISQDEAQAAPVVARSFTTADKDKDGKISMEEFNQSFTTAAPAPRSESPDAGTTAPSTPSTPSTPPPQ
jgi:Ca2+-binding EF-hand superfamily protein